jgi:DNA invertase Pin-like site-specific DNA recombinase
MPVARKTAADPHPASPPRRAAVYSRISNPGDKRDASLDTQEEATINAVRRLGYTVDPEDVYRERFTGKDSGREVLDRVRDGLRSGRYQAIGFYCLDRLVRSQVHCAILFDEFERLKVAAISATNDAYDDSPEGKLFRAIRAYLGEAERIKIGERNNRGKRRYRELGVFVKLGVTKIGWRWDKEQRRRLIVPEEAGLAREVFERSARGESFHAITKDFNRRRVPIASMMRKKRGASWRPWTITRLREMVRDPAYKGVTVCNRWYRDQRVNKYTGRATPKVCERPEEEWIILDDSGLITEPIVDADLWERANRAATERIHNQNSGHTRYGKANAHLLRGIAWCARCGHKMYPHFCHQKGIDKKHRRKQSWFYYGCQTKSTMFRIRHPDTPRCEMPMLRADHLDEAVWSEFVECVLTPGYIESICESIQQGGPRARIEADLEAARRLLDKTERLRTTLYDRYRSEMASADPDLDFAAKLEADFKAQRVQVASYRAAIVDLERQIQLMGRAADSREVIGSKLGELRRLLAEGKEIAWQDRWEFLRIAGVRVVAGEEFFDLYSDLLDARPDGPENGPESTSKLDGTSRSSRSTGRRIRPWSPTRSDGGE